MFLLSLGLGVIPGLCAEGSLPVDSGPPQVLRTESWSVGCPIAAVPRCVSKAPVAVEALQLFLEALRDINDLEIGELSEL